MIIYNGIVEKLAIRLTPIIVAISGNQHQCRRTKLPVGPKLIINVEGNEFVPYHPKHNQATSISLNHIAHKFHYNGMLIVIS